MKQTIFTLLILSVISLASCRKNTNQLDIKQYDQQQIENYIAANGITGMVKDTVGGDTTGIYYKILTKGTGPVLNYPTQVYFVYTIKSFDGKYTSVDTINNHFYDYVGHIKTDNLPAGLQLAMHNDLVNDGGTMRVLIPSHLAYGVNGSGSGSSQVANNRIAGNQSLDYYINAVSNIPAYDDKVIQNYMRDSSLTGYTKTADGLYYKILTQGTGNSAINTNSTITCTYTGQLLNAVLFDSAFNGTNIATLDVVDLVPGVIEGLEQAVAGTKISLLIPSGLGYGYASQTSIPAYSCLRFTFTVITVTP